MDTRSRASSSTDPEAPAGESPDATAGRGDTPPASGTAAVDNAASGARPDTSSVDRRAFFRAFSRQTVTAVAQVAGIAGAVQRGTAAAVVEAVGMGFGDPQENAARIAAAGTPGEPAALRGVGANRAGIDGQYRSAYRMEPDGLVLIDQRVLPDRVVEIRCIRAADVAFQMRTFACNGASLLGQLAAYGMALSAREAASWPRLRRDAELRRSAQLLRYARPTVHPVRVTIARMEARAQTAGGEGNEDGRAVADALAAEADAIADELTNANAAIARATADLLRPATPDGPLGVLVLGDPGQLTSGQVGPGVTALQLLVSFGVELRVWVAEGHPRREGGRLGSWELRNAGINHTLIEDSAIGWLFARERIDAVILAVDWIDPLGAAIAMIGARPVAELARLRLHGTPTRVIALAPGLALSAESFDLGGLPDPTVPAGIHDASSVGVSRAEPQVEALPASCLDAVVTENGVHQPPFAETLPRAA